MKTTSSAIKKIATHTAKVANALQPLGAFTKPESPAHRFAELHGKWLTSHVAFSEKKPMRMFSTMSP